MHEFILIDKKYNDIVWSHYYSKEWYNEIIAGFNSSKRKPPNAIMLDDGVIYDIRKDEFWLEEKKYNEIIGKN